MKIDALKLAKESLGPLREALKPILAQGGDHAKALVRDLQDYEDDLATTVKALQEEKDPARAALLREDVERFLPQRKQAIVSRAASQLGSDGEAAAEAALDVAIKVAVTVARAMTGI